jgi:hypothetical protein
MTETLPVETALGDDVVSLQDQPDGAYDVETAVIWTIHASLFARSSRVTGVSR